MLTKNATKTHSHSAKGLLFSFVFTVTAFSSISAMATPVIASTSNMPKTVAAADMEVWKSATGKCYHSKNNCGSMNPSKATKIKESKAKSMGLKKCKNCW